MSKSKIEMFFHCECATHINEFLKSVIAAFSLLNRHEHECENVIDTSLWKIKK